jgi:hypothetical protein
MRQYIDKEIHILKADAMFKRKIINDRYGPRLNLTFLNIFIHLISRYQLNNL